VETEDRLGYQQENTTSDTHGQCVAPPLPTGSQPEGRPEGHCLHRPSGVPLDMGCGGHINKPNLTKPGPRSGKGGPTGACVSNPLVPSEESRGARVFLRVP
jgi:hypothetical protein